MSAADEDIRELVRVGVHHEAAAQLNDGLDLIAKAATASVIVALMPVRGQARPLPIVRANVPANAPPAVLATCEVLLNETLLQLAGDLRFAGAVIRPGEVLESDFRPLPSNLQDLITRAVRSAEAKPDKTTDTTDA